jgi:phage-related holin
MDCVSAYRLSRRVRRKKKASTGKFRSDKGKKAFVTMAQIFYLVMMAYLIDFFILKSPNDLWTVRSVLLVFSFVEAWSILENESSLNGSKWAKLLQKVMVSKVERHYDVDLPEFKN